MTRNSASTLNSPPSTSSPPPDWRQRADHFHEQQWSLAQELLAVGRRILLNHLGQLKTSTSLAQVEKLLRLADKLGQVSSRLAPPEQKDSECPKCCAFRLEMEAALEKAYGRPLPGEETDAQASTAPKPGEASPGCSNPNLQSSTH
jgi:hypothetical protein